MRHVLIINLNMKIKYHFLNYLARHCRSRVIELCNMVNFVDFGMVTEDEILVTECSRKNISSHFPILLILILPFCQFRHGQ